MGPVPSLLIRLEFAAALAAGLMGGLFYAFSFTVMEALGRLPPAEGAAAMRHINRTILKPAFLALFLGTPAVCVSILVLAITRWHEPGSLAAILGSAVYIAGIFAVTMLCNVPRNDTLERAHPDDPGTDELWRAYLKEWTAWNHVRTAAGLAAAALLTVAMLLQAGI